MRNSHALAGVVNLRVRRKIAAAGGNADIGALPDLQIDISGLQFVVDQIIDHDGDRRLAET
jgi:hypothetical protein